MTNKQTSALLERKWLEPKDIQDMTGFGKTKVFDILKSGELPSFKHGRLRRIPPEGFTQWQRNLEAKANKSEASA